MPPSTDLLQGTLDVLILKTLALEPMHGWGVAQRIQQISKDVLQIGQGSLYPALHRLVFWRYRRPAPELIFWRVVNASALPCESL